MARRRVIGSVTAAAFIALSFLPQVALAQDLIQGGNSSASSSQNLGSNATTAGPPQQKPRNEQRPDRGDGDGGDDKRHGGSQNGDEDFCNRADGCDPYATIYIAVALFAMLTIGMIYVIYKRRKVRRLVNIAHSPPLLEMNRGFAKDDHIEGDFATTASPHESVTGGAERINGHRAL
ncbi:Aste57867_22376 [Aphanomyces stellatus]|uniref:Aste57867_22376 protein n=1 Tax=Aphanomyces stellatus TaxID=120398 RepID=A0A485LKN6_9STRA|nr:hypothetical protein As57867_022306 [Aphanomyces stellatus]VFT99039.1 Aste57867_22376 [Aphanomyces stellatus]